MLMQKQNLFNFFITSVFALFLMVATSPFIQTAFAADGLDIALTNFTKDKFPQTEAGIKALSATGNPRAAIILQALLDNRLLFKPYASDDEVGVFLTDDKGALVEAASGKPASLSADSLKKVRLNNGLRSKLQAAIGSLTLLSPDPLVRLSAAQAVLKARDSTALTTLDGALAKEHDGKVKTAMLQAKSALVALNPDAPAAERLIAIDALRSVANQDSISILSDIPTSSDPQIANAVKTAISTIQGQLALWANGQNIVYGLSLGSVLLLAAIGLAITFGVMGIINMAHGEMVMLGAYTVFVVQEYLRTHAPQYFDYSLAISVPLAFLVAAFAGMIIERFVIRYLYGRPLETLLATWGISLILQQTVRSIFGANNREVGAPSFMSGSLDIGQMTITYGRLWIIVFTIFVFVALQILLRASSFGLAMRAVTQNRRMASAMGIDTRRIDALAFGLGSGIAGIAGVALSQIDNVSPNLGQGYIIDSFMVVVFGGVGNLWGTLVGALTLGIAGKVLEPLVGAVLAKIGLLVMIILFIQRRPRGLFALKGRAVEA